MRDQAVRVRPELAHEQLGAGIVLSTLEVQRGRDAGFEADTRRNVAAIHDHARLLRPIVQATGALDERAGAHEPEHHGAGGRENEREDEPVHQTIVAFGACAVLDHG